MYGMPIGFSNLCCTMPGMQAFGPTPTQQDSIFGGCTNATCPSNDSITSAYVGGEMARQQDETSSAMNKLGFSLVKSEQELENALKQDGLNDTQKGRLKQQLDLVKAKKAAFENKVKNLDLKSLSPQELQSLQEELRSIQSEVDVASNVADEIKKQIEKNNETANGQNGGSAGSSGTATDASDATDAADAEDATSGSDSDSTITIDGENEGDDPITIDSKTGKPAELGAAPSRADIADICLKIRQSITCSGTNHDVLDAMIKGLDDTNIIEIVKYWEDNYNKGNKAKEGFFRKIFADVGDDWQSTYVPIMRAALAQRAEALGIGDQVEVQLAKVDMELTKGPSWKKLWCGSYQDDKTIADGLSAAYKLIKEKEESNIKAAKSKVAAAEAAKETKAKEDKKAAAEELRKTREQFRLDMCEIWEDDELLISDKVEYKDGQWQIRIKGRTYYGSDFLSLAQAIERAGLNPKEHLCTKHIDTAA